MPTERSRRRDGRSVAGRRPDANLRPTFLSRRSMDLCSPFEPLRAQDADCGLIGHTRKPDGDGRSRAGEGYKRSERGTQQCTDEGPGEADIAELEARSRTIRSTASVPYAGSLRRGIIEQCLIGRSHEPLITSGCRVVRRDSDSWARYRREPDDLRRCAMQEGELTAGHRVRLRAAERITGPPPRPSTAPARLHARYNLQPLT